MNASPIPDVTKFDGCRNLPSYYPDGNAKPDVGVYIAGSGIRILI
jgi:hypothetical protein